MARISALLGWLALSLVPAAAQALGLGDIRLNSALNQPLRAEIELLSASREELSSLRASLASAEAFARYGIERPTYITDLSFRLGRSADGRDVLQVSSPQALTEPFVTFLVEVNWARGRLLREYTVLLDPPTFMPGERQASRPVAAPTRDTAEPIRRPEPAAPPAAAPSRPVAAAPRPAQAAPPAGLDQDRVYRVNRNDTLWRIADQLRSADVNVNQMMIALYRQNPTAFYGNINLLKAGADLQIPAAIDVGSSEALAEVRRQTEEWQAGRAAAEPARLRLVAADEAGESAAAAPGAAPSGDRAPTAADAGTAALQRQVGDLQRELEESRRLVQMRDQQLADLQRQLAEVSAAPPAGAPTPGPAPVDEAPIDEAAIGEPPGEAPIAETGEPPLEEAPLEEAVEPTPPPVEQPAPSRVVTPPPSPSLLERVAGHVADNGAMYLIGLGVLALLGGGLVFLRRRQESEDLTGSWEALAEPEETEDEEVTTADREPTERLSKPKQRESIVVVEQDEAAARPARRPERPAAAASAAPAAAVPAAVELDKNDPLAEADFHMAYGLYDQAADLVNLAIQRNPDRRDLKLKLLEIFFVWGNKEAFLETARELHDSRDEAPAGEWDKILIMGKQICPEELLFQEEPGAAVGALDSIDVELAEGEAAAELDLAVGSDDAGEEGLDFDLAEAFGEEEGEATVERAAKTAEMSGIDFAFDLDTTQESPTVEQPGSEAPTVQTRRVSADQSPTMETPTIETPQMDEEEEEEMFTEQGTLRIRSPMRDDEDDIHPPDQTAEIELDALGLDLDELEATGRRPAADDSDEEGGGTVVRHDFDAEGTGTVVMDDDEFDTADTASIRALTEDEESGHTVRRPSPASDIDVDLDRMSGLGDEAEADTVRRPEGHGEVDEFGDVFAGSEASRTDIDVDVSDVDEDIDFDIGEAARDEDHARTEEVGAEELEPVTMSEVGTKLDLARAYMDMGDPDGARSILQEVLEEGNEAQRRDAEKLMNALP